MSNGSPYRPTRSWRKKTGPGDVNLITRAMRANNGPTNTSKVAATTTSNSRFARPRHPDLGRGAIQVTIPDPTLREANRSAEMSTRVEARSTYR